MREVDDVGHALHLTDLDGRDVARQDQRLPSGEGPEGAAVIVVRRVAAEARRLVLEDGGQGDLVVPQRRLVHVSLEGRARLAFGGDDVVLTADRVVAIVRRSDPGQDLARLRIRGEKRAVVGVGVAQRLDALLDRLFGQRLQPQIQSRVHDQPALLHRRRTEQRFELREDVVDEVGRGALARARLDVNLLLDVFGLCGFCLLLAQGVRVHHAPEHVLLATGCELEVEDGVIGAGGLDQPGEEGGLRRRQVLRVLAKIGPRGRPHPIRAVAEVDTVQVHGEDLVLGEALLERDRQHQLVKLSGQRLLGGQELDLDQLLRDRAPALVEAAVGDVDPQRAQRRGDVDRTVLVEVAVLCR